MKIITGIIAALALSVSAQAQQFPEYTARNLMDRVRSDDTVYVVNFWATWCAPCVTELPAFDTVQSRFAGKPVKVLLVSLDFRDDYARKLPAFVARKKPQPEIVWFSETNANRFIPEIDDRWSGAIPATMVIRGGKQTFLERTVSAGEIIGLVAEMTE